MSYTSQTKADVALLEKALLWTVQGGMKLRVLEIGTYAGDTSREIKRWADERHIELVFIGIDNGSHPSFAGGVLPGAPFPEATMIYGDSAEVFHLVPTGLDLVLVDGCHCINHVILDTLHYGAKVRLGGVMLFHDTSPEIQQTMKDPHGPDIPEFHNSVVAAHRLMGFPTPNWKLLARAYEPGAPWGGMSVYEKVA